MTVAADRFLQTQYDVLRIPGIHYDTLAGRCDPPVSHYADCSGLQCYAYRMIVGPVPGGCIASFGIRQWCERAGTAMSVAEARRTKGAWVTIHGNGRHHIGCSTGDGRVFAARGRSVHPNIGFSSFEGNDWNFAGWPPGLPRDVAQDPNPGPGTPSEARAMGMVAAKIVPGAHQQKSAKAKAIGWWMHYPFVAAVQRADKSWDLVGYNGAKLLDRGAVSFLGMSILHLGTLNQPIEDVDLDERHRIVFLAGDGGTFIPHPRAVYV